MGITQSMIEIIMRPIDHCIEICEDSSCHSKCSDCCEMDLETHHQNHGHEKT